MQKTKAILLSKNKVNSPSPDSKSGNSVKATNSPMQQIQKFLAINHHQSKVKKQLSLVKLASNSNQMSNQKQEEYKVHIKNLEDQVAQYKNYMKEYELLAIKNKKLEQQMFLILQQLENRCKKDNIERADAQLTPSPKGRINLTTIQSSNQDQNYSRLDNRYINSTRIRQQNRDEQIEYLYEYISNLEETMNITMSHCKQMQIQIRKHVKKDLNQMEQRLMSYIFGLEERVSEATFRNHDLMKKISTARDKQQQFLSYSKRSDQFSRKRNSGDFIESGNSIFKLSRTERKSDNQSPNKESIISLINMQVNNSLNENIKQQKKIKKSLYEEYNLDQSFHPKITINKCQKCCEYLQSIDLLNGKCSKLEQELNKAKGLIAMNQFKRLSNSQNISRSLSGKNIFKITESELGVLQEVVQSSHQQQSLVVKQPKLKVSEFNRSGSHQSHINIVLQLSGQEDQEINKSDDINKSGSKSEKKSTKSKAQKILKMEKLRQQLVNILQQLQQVVHQCQSAEQNSLISQLYKKIKVQGDQISQLQEQVSKLKMQIQDNKASRERLQKQLKMKGKQQEIHSPYFRPISEPISCIDHKQTKGKIDHIINSIKKFELEIGKNQEK